MSVKELFSGTLPRRPSLGEEAADKLREMILAEIYPAGDQLPEQELAEALGISRTPLRDALSILVSEGLVVHKGMRRTFFVANPSIEELANDLAIIGVLEGLAGEQACAHASNEQLKEIEDVKIRMNEEATNLNVLQLFEIDMMFHRKIVEAAQNPALAQTHQRYNARLWRARFVSAKTKSKRHDQQAMHDQIMSALLARDPQMTMSALRKHMSNAVDNIRIAIDEKSARVDLDGE